MNDRFKFRVWNKEQQKLYSWDDLKKSKGDNSFYWCMLQAQNDEKNNILMQCTGLKDKNGKLIYEGDIVKYKDEVYDLCIGRIQWDNAHYELQYYTGEKYGWFSHILCLKHIKNVEVIGNIYKNKELLDGE